ncbi:5'-3' exonuclease H3TH domain-containing protein [Bacillus sp. 31A1R]|uniref:5'-3' exonuclease n=1 Tax=Robertmurraya mangrovi TaxID=3098077 RepID=A0ABU5J1A8_9BACI|nr:5'-3' exonuclease H3TH domain-containing protein [Bacillus sp. 31A1R]MDZ5473184.1 5'-3' exonuclease H3TH domain-containing protein [Bacillus sp. 31A1R]
MEQKPTLMLVDGMALLFRAFFATAVTGQFMINSKGVPTNGIHGFVKHFLTAVSSFKPTHVAVCWDMGSKTFRTEIFQDYKANRSEAPVELIPQFDLVKEVVEAFNVPNIGLAGYEADDCIGTIAKNMDGDLNISILTGDRDILQLLDERVSVILLQKGYGNYLVHTPETFYEEKGISPNQMIDLKALMGDPSDNYPGVKGIGEKTALKLVQQFEHVEGIVSNLDQLTKSQKAKIEQDLEMLYLSRQLAEIKCDVPIEYSLEEAILNYKHDHVLNKFQELEFKGLHKMLQTEKEYA